MARHRERRALNLGLRLSLFGTFHEANDDAYNWEKSAFDPTVASGITVDTGGGLRMVNSLLPIPIYQSNGAVNPVLTNGIVQCGKGGRPSSCMSGHLFNPAPRVGFTWDPFGSGKMALRGGYGIFFEHGTADEANTGSLEGGAPTVLSMTQINPAGWSTIGETETNQGTQSLSPIAFALNVTSIPTKATWPYVQQWSASAERQLPGNALVSFAYVGSKGTHLTVALEANQLQPLSAGNNPFGLNEPLKTRGPNPAAAGSGSSGDCAVTAGVVTLTNGTIVQPGDPSYSNLVTACYAAAQSNTANLPSPNALRTYAPGLGEIYSLQNVADSGYNAFQATMRKVQGPLTLGVAYTYSHSLDDASDRSDATFVNSFDLKSNRSSSNFDQRHLLHVSYIYDLNLISYFEHIFHFADDDPANQASHYPGYSYNAKAWESSSLVKGVLGDWQISGLGLFESGIPSPSSTTDLRPASAPSTTAASPTALVPVRIPIAPACPLTGAYQRVAPMPRASDRCSSIPPPLSHRED